MPGPSLGTNLSSIVDWSTATPFVDIFQTSRHWFTQRDGAFDTGQASMLDLDAAGWVKDFTKDGSTPPFSRVCTLINTSELPFKAGHYVIEWKGQGEIQVSNAQVISREGNKLVVDPGDGAMGLNIESTDPRNTGDYIRDIKMYHADDADLMAAGVTFNPDFLARIEDFRVLRFMDWMGTNNATIDPIGGVLAEDVARHSVGGPQRGGASLEVMVELANEARADPWFTVPHGASPEWIRQFATYVKEHLDPGLVARFEYSNEVWNWGFQQAQWAQGEAVKAWGSGVQGGWMQMYGVKAAEMAHIVADVFGAETGTRALNVFSTQSGWKGLETYALDAPDHVKRGGEAPKDAPFHVYAIAPYFGGSIGSEEMKAQVNAWIAQGEAGMQAALAYLRSGPAGDSIKNLAGTVAYHAAVADGLGWDLEGYEGGQHVVDLAGLFGGGAEDPKRTAFFAALAARSEMGSLYTDYFNMWKSAGGGLMAQFSDFGTPSRYGAWGIWESPTSPQTPRGAAVEAFRDNVEAWWDDDRPASIFEPQPDGPVTPVPPVPPVPPVTPASITGTAFSDALNGTDGRDKIYGLDGDDRLDGRSGDDEVYGGAGADRLVGGADTDTLDGGDGGDQLFGGDGADKLLGQAGGDLLDGGTGSDDLQGGDGVDRLLGQAGDDLLDGGAGDDNLRGGDGNDRVKGGAGHDFLLLDGGNDWLDGGEGSDCLQVEGALGVRIDLALTGAQATGLGLDTILGMEHVFGGEGGDRILGSSAGNLLKGMGGNDDLQGRTGGDTLVGGAGRDLLSGGQDKTRDLFVFNAPSDTRVGADRDVISDFERGIDDIDLRGIDANASVAGDQAFRFVSGPAAGGVWIASSGSTLLLRGDVNGDVVADFEIQVNGTASLMASDMLL